MAETSADLNLKLMKWRLLPELDLEILKQAKCLLLGAGTLGCVVARNLLAWGFRHITFVDNGKVSYSNPVRQSLYTIDDCLDGGKSKAIAAADAIKKILPTVTCEGICLHIPMPGHPIGESIYKQTEDDLKTLTDKIKGHDVIFLLLDSREARWLPTLLAGHYKKMVINAALGFDSYLVMRHGIPTNGSPMRVGSPWIDGHKLGCYFCNDVTAPGNSLKERTLDQQCTVTRPGVSSIAGALAVELTVALLQHKLGTNAPAGFYVSETQMGCSEDENSLLGPIPHSIRGFLSTYQHILPATSKFSQCITCSTAVLDLYDKDREQFLMKVFDSTKYLEQVTGLRELQMSAEISEMLALSDSDDLTDSDEP